MRRFWSRRGLLFKELGLGAVVVGYLLKICGGIACFDLNFHALILSVIDIVVIVSSQELANNCLNLLVCFRFNQSMVLHKRLFELEMLNIEPVLEKLSDL